MLQAERSIRSVSGTAPGRTARRSSRKAFRVDYKDAVNDDTFKEALFKGSECVSAARRPPRPISCRAD